MFPFAFLRTCPLQRVLMSKIQYHRPLCKETCLGYRNKTQEATELRDFCMAALATRTMPALALLFCLIKCTYFKECLLASEHHTPKIRACFLHHQVTFLCNVFPT
jgi:hypothetical protein